MARALDNLDPLQLFEGFDSSGAAVGKAEPLLGDGPLILQPGHTDLTLRGAAPHKGQHKVAGCKVPLPDPEVQVRPTPLRHIEGNLKDSKILGGLPKLPFGTRPGRRDGRMVVPSEEQRVVGVGVGTRGRPRHEGRLDRNRSSISCRTRWKR